MSDIYDIKPTKAVYYFIITRRKDSHQFIMTKEERPDDFLELRDTIIIRDADTNQEVANNTWEEIVEELESKSYKKEIE